MPLVVEKIENGTVIDHIPAGLGLKVLEILKIDRTYGARVALMMNVPSKKIGKKDIVKVEGKQLDEKAVNRIALVAPNATLNIIRKANVVEKKVVQLPKELLGVSKCPNPQCITNLEPIETIFRMENSKSSKYRCGFCEMAFEANELLL
ncbi:MAG: Aspartate carbamoyltransferase regulatory chain (PyrI) [Candidatus Fermentimicrarchaeum limneticum]|jgi:aspartate carbamoyltransferase regulatory subunit|uniref:Aspartate carbamoyltransferase regulatory chain n=1 Tax=Fermentimicrarchaeum limneticum TaxID=2795018 RepID=A0A7D6BVE0_FERL1|nr:MAG: Aspartate carbamoyltransferase regulatory chain (PyrI) [Candidatus Fermentimicrarchaeum limneticum]